MSPITVSPAAEEVFEAEDESAELVFRPDDGDELLGQRPLYHPHAADFADFRAARGDAAGRGRGLEARWERHRVNQLALIAGLEAMGLDLLVKKPGGPFADGYGVNDSSGMTMRRRGISCSTSSTSRSPGDSGW